MLRKKKNTFDNLKNCVTTEDKSCPRKGNRGPQLVKWDQTT